MSKNKIDDLRDHLFIALERLNDLDVPVDGSRVQALVSVSEQIIESAKAEALMLRSIGADSSNSNLWKSVLLTQQPRRLA